MSNLEVIKVRTDVQSVDELSAQIAESVGRELNESVTIYRSTHAPTDLAIHIRHDDGHGDAQPSKIGQRLASGLRSYGTVEHVIWIEATEEGAKA